MSERTSGVQPSFPRKRESSDFAATEATTLDSRFRGIDELTQKSTPIRLGDVADVFVGYPFRSETFATEGVRLLRGDNISQGHIEWTDAVKLPFEFASEFSAFELGEGDLVLAMDRPWVSAGLKFASVRKHDAGALLVQRTARLRGVGGNKTEFLRYVVASPAFTKYIKGVTTGSLVPHISKEQIQDFSFFLPTANAQQEIAAVLSTIDAKIDLNNRINAELEAMAKTIYDYWFVQFDFPDANGRPYKSSGGAMVWNETLKREIPAEWTVTNLAAWIAKQKTGEWGSSELSDNNEVQITCIRGADINALNGSGELKAPTRYISSSKSGKLLAPYDIVIEISGGSPTQSTGRAALIGQEVSNRFDNPLVCSNFCKALTLKEPVRAYEFLQLWNALYSGGIFFGWEGKTSGIKNLQFDSFVDNHSVPAAPPELSRRFQSLSRSLEKRKQNGLRENQELTQLRDWLLPLLMNGQVRVA